MNASASPLQDGEYPGSDVVLRFENEGTHPVSIKMGWDGEDLVVWVEMDCGEVGSDASFGIGGYELTGVNVKACANFSISDDQAREWRDALTKLIEVPCDA